jgi:hypothetical protein
MSTEFTVIKVNNGFNYATDSDRDAASCYKLGQALKVSAVKQSARSIQHHKLFFGGLLEVMLDHWEPDSAMTTEAERKLIMQFCKVLDDNGGGGEVSNWGRSFLGKLAQNRAQKIESPHKTKEGLLLWLKDKVDHVELVVTPSGIKRVPKSINFNSMSREQFGVFYKKCFSVCWKYILSQKFDSEAECQNVIDQLSSMG